MSIYPLVLVAFFVAVISIALIVTILFQNPKGEGGNLLAGNSGVKKLVGAAEIPNFLEKITYFLFAVLVLLTLLFTSLVNRYYTPL